MSETIVDVLASRYASPSVQAIWSERGRVVLERRFWIAVMKAQRDLGLDIPPEAIDSYERAVEQVDLESIRAREEVSRHDVKARIEEFCSLAGHEHIHKGLTSRDLTDNVEQFQVLRSLQLLQAKYVAVLLALSEKVRQYRDLTITARTHHAAAQPTTLGKRLAMFGEEMLCAFARLEELVAGYPLRGLKGAVGTCLDQLTLFDHDREKVRALQVRVMEYLGFGRQLEATGQVYPRSLDFEVLACLYQLGAGVASLARTLRLMAGAEAVTEGFAPGQVGSSAMPHKMNTRTVERIDGLQAVLGGYVHMAGSLAGDQWFEGDVSCSVVRRVALPDGVFALDGMLEAALHVLDGMGVYQWVLRRELERYLPFLSTTTLLMEAVRQGAGREQAHAAIKEHAVAAALAMREQGRADNDLVQRLAADCRIPLAPEQIEAICRQAGDLVGLAAEQADTYVRRVEALADRYPQARQVRKGRLL